MATTGSHPAIKLKKHIQIAVEGNRRASQAQSNTSQSQTDSNTLTVNDSTSTSGMNIARRKSTHKPGAAGFVAAAINMRRLTRASITIPQEPMPKMNVRYENTYKMEPEDGTKFQNNGIERKVYSILEEHVKDLSYDAATAAHLSETIADMVKTSVKGLFSPRYKLVTSVLIGQNQSQGMEAASRCLWDDSKDNFASVCYKNKSLFVTVLIFGCYFE